MLKIFSGDARELNSVRSEEKWIFFPSWTGSSSFRPDFDLLGACSHEEAKPPESSKRMCQ